MCALSGTCCELASALAIARASADFFRIVRKHLRHSATIPDVHEVKAVLRNELPDRYSPVAGFGEGQPFKRNVRKAGN